MPVTEWFHTTQIIAIPLMLSPQVNLLNRSLQIPEGRPLLQVQLSLDQAHYYNTDNFKRIN